MDGSGPYDTTRQPVLEPYAWPALPPFDLAALGNLLPTSTATLGANGTITWVNEAWSSFAVAQGGNPAACGVGVNYLAVTARAASAGDRLAQAALDGLRAVVTGQQSDFSLVYPCHAPSVAAGSRSRRCTGPDTGLWSSTPTSRSCVRPSPLPTSVPSVSTDCEPGDRFAIIVDLNGTVQYCNSAITRLLGYAPAAMEGQHFTVFLRPDETQAVRALFAERVAQTLPQPVTERYSVLHHDETPRWLEVSISDQRDDPGGGRLHWHGRDITERLSLDSAGRPRRARRPDRPRHPPAVGRAR